MARRTRKQLNMPSSLPPPLPLPLPPPSTKRKSYTADFKLQVVRELSAPSPAGTQAQGGGANAPSVRSLAARHGITPSMLRKWVASCAELEAAVLGQRSAASAPSAQLRKLGSGRRPEHQEIDDALASWVRRQRALGVAVKDRDMQAQARALAAAQGLVGFRASKGYICKFKTRHALGNIGPAASGTGRRGRALASEGGAFSVDGADAGRPAGACLFGMDIGTTAVKCAVVSATTGGVLATSSAMIEPSADQQPQCTGESNAHADGNGGEKVNVKELDVPAVLLAVRSAIQRLPTPLRAQIASIGVCGRMHGILWWRCDAVAKAVDRLFSTVPIGPGAPATAAATTNEDLHAWSKYITFLDQRCSPAFLEQCRTRITRSLQSAQAPAADGGDANEGWEGSRSSPIATGYGLASFAYMMQERPRELVGFDACGTIQDLVAFALCRHALPAQSCMDTTNAFSWGGFDMRTNDWNPLTVAALELPLHMLPTVRAPGQVIGYSNNGDGASTDAFGLPSGTPVYIPMGEHPCTVVAAIAQAGHIDNAATPSLALVNIGTATQLAVVLSAQDVARLDQRAMHKSFEIRPFLSEYHFLGVAASLSGGNIFAWFVRQCLEWSRELAVDPSFNQLSEQEMYVRLIALGARRIATDLEFQPTLNGERGEPDAHGAINRLRTANWSVGDIGAAICKGVVDNLFGIVPRELAAGLPGQQMIGTGAAVVRNALFQHFLAKKAAEATGGTLKIQETTDAAVGVAFTPSLLQRTDWLRGNC